ncbi:hypothetical protein C6990_01810 [Nitrosopumilus sp. b3]|uniref:hypothetical protein n=1 Tax=Nitrosopumilus sp. b3 TaxID=2109909 RepID=UPI0015F630DF|nr:hypothetical protein [Nitrosopumilus sp. b3]KAF6248196.1 hypothetical protein C6990_01810 [Nitrosopumilus sp. b3]
MNKGIIIGVAIAIIIGVGVLVASGNYSEDISEISLEEEVKNEPKQFTIGLDESVGVSGG